MSVYGIHNVATTFVTKKNIYDVVSHDSKVIFLGFLVYGPTRFLFALLCSPLFKKGKLKEG